MGGAFALPCCKTHAKICNEIKIQPRSEIVGLTHANFNLKLCTRGDGIWETGTLTATQILVQICFQRGSLLKQVKYNTFVLF